MSHEIELKAHINENKSIQIKVALNDIKEAFYLGTIDKEDLYWNYPNSDSSLFRTRYEKTEKGEYVLFTSKPSKSNDNRIEINEENEFRAISNDWNSIIKFCEGLNLVVSRRKYKTGFHFIYKLNGFDIHCEVLNVKYLGWFFECEICINEIDEITICNAKNTLNQLLLIFNIPESAIEIKGYNKLLREVGHLLG